MYIPQHFREEDREKLLAFMRENSFATLVTSAGEVPLATHLPFIIEQRAEKIFLISHMAKVNPQWNAFNENECLVIFQGPHAYISPSNYEKQQNVPTWNYIAVHAKGRATIFDQDQLYSLMEKTIGNFEDKFHAQWKSLSPEYVNGMLKAIVGFEIEVSALEGNFKLSQNKTEAERIKIIQDLSESSSGSARDLAIEMKKNLKPA